MNFKEENGFLIKMVINEEQSEKKMTEIKLKRQCTSMNFGDWNQAIDIKIMIWFLFWIKICQKGTSYLLRRPV